MQSISIVFLRLQKGNDERVRICIRIMKKGLKGYMSWEMFGGEDIRF